MKHFLLLRRDELSRHEETRGKQLHISKRKSGLPWWLSGKESACSAGDPGSIPGSGRSLGDGIGYPLQYSWASLVAQMVKNLVKSRLLEYVGEGEGWTI